MKNVAVFGAGRIGRIHATNLASLPGVRVKCVSDAWQTAADDLAHELRAEASSIETALADPSVEAVIICSPTSTHSEFIARAVAAGKHIFCEKPVDLSVQRAHVVAQAVADAGVGCMIGFQRRFDPTFSEAHRRMEAGDIGVPEMLIITSRDPSPPPATYIEQSGGIFRDMLIHDFDVFRWMLCADGDEAAWLSATGSVLIDPEVGVAGDYDCAAVTIRTRKGRLCQINTSRRAAYGYDQRFELLGSLGLLECANHTANEVRQWDANGITANKPEAFFLQRYVAAYRLEISHFLDCLQSGQPFKTTIHDGLEAQKLAAAAAESASTGQAINL